MNILKIVLNFYISLHMGCVQISLLRNKPAKKQFFPHNAIEFLIINKETKVSKKNFCEICEQGS